MATVGVKGLILIL